MRYGDPFDFPIDGWDYRVGSGAGRDGDREPDVDRSVANRVSVGLGELGRNVDSQLFVDYRRLEIKR